MKVGPWTLFWIFVILALVLIEIGEITHLFTVPITLAFLTPYSLLFALVLITILALVGAVFVGFYLSSRVYAARGFTPFEEEMLRMRDELTQLRTELRAIGDRMVAPRDDPPSGPRPEERKR